MKMKSIFLNYSSFYMMAALVITGCGGGNDNKGSNPGNHSAYQQNSSNCSDQFVNDYNNVALGMIPITITVKNLDKAQSLVNDFSSKYQGVVCQARFIKDGKDSHIDSTPSLIDVSAKVTEWKNQITSAADITPAYSPEQMHEFARLLIESRQPDGSLAYPLECIKLIAEYSNGNFCKTAAPKNKYFKVVNDELLGLSIQEMGNGNEPGTIWAFQLTAENKNFKEAQTACPSGTRPPTQAEFTRLRSSVGTEEFKSDSDWDKQYNKELLSAAGKKELYALLSNMKDHWFWSSSPIDSVSAFFFVGGYYVYAGDRDRNYISVRCVR